MAHISHLIEDRDITISTIANIAMVAATGQLNGATEKMDGANITFSCTSKYEARFSRSEGDIKKGGMPHAVLEAKFSGRGLVQDTFSGGAKAIRASIRALAPQELIKTFEGLQCWYSAEVIYTKNPNIVSYDHDAIVLHERPVLRHFGDDVFPVIDGHLGDKNFAVLRSRLIDMDANVRELGWRVLGPQIVKLNRVKSASSWNALNAVLVGMGGCSTTIQDFLVARAKDDLKRFGMSEDLFEASARRLSEMQGCPSLTILRARVPSSVAVMLRASDVWITKQLRPLELAISDFAIDLLADAKPSLVCDPDAETECMRSKLKEALVKIEKSRNQHSIDYAKYQMEKLKDVDRVTTPLEGIVFPWGGKLYKLTGAFAPLNAIVGLCRYGRGKLMPAIV